MPRGCPVRVTALLFETPENAMEKVAGSGQWLEGSNLRATKKNTVRVVPHVTEQYI